MANGLMVNTLRILISDLMQDENKEEFEKWIKVNYSYGGYGSNKVVQDAFYTAINLGFKKGYEFAYKHLTASDIAKEKRNEILLLLSQMKHDIKEPEANYGLHKAIEAIEENIK